MRLDALLSRYGYCSRREAPGWIKRHSITFKGEPCSAPTDKVQAEGILLDGEPVEFPDGPVRRPLQARGIYVQP